LNWWKQIISGQDNTDGTDPHKGVEQDVKNRLRSSPFFAALFKKFSIPLGALDDLTIIVQKIDGGFCAGNGDKIVIDENVVKSGELFGRKFHYIAHEILHFLRRKLEDLDYFADPEEVESYTTAIAYAIYEWRNKKHLGKLLVNEFLPLVNITIQDETASKKFLKHRIDDAKKLLKEMSLCNFS